MVMEQPMVRWIRDVYFFIDVCNMLNIASKPNKNLTRCRELVEDMTIVSHIAWSQNGNGEEYEVTYRKLKE